MSISVTYEPEADDFARAFREVANRGFMRIILYGVGFGIPILQSIAALANAETRADSNPLWWQLGVWWIMFPLLFWGGMRLFRWLFIRRFVKDDASQRGTQVRRLDGDGLHITSPGVSASVNWSVLRSAVETRHFFLLFQTRD